MNIKLVGDETPEVGIIPIVKALNQLHKINESKTVNRLDLESIDSNIPNAFIDKGTGWTFKHLPSGISNIDNSNSRTVINDAIANLSEMLDTRYKSLVVSYGVLLNNLDIKAPGLAIYLREDVQYSCGSSVSTLSLDR